MVRNVLYTLSHHEFDVYFACVGGNCMHTCILKEVLKRMYMPPFSQVLLLYNECALVEYLLLSLLFVQELCACHSLL